MNLSYFWQAIKSKRLVIGIFVLVFFILGVGLTLVQPLKYSSSLRLLVVQDASNVASDPYTMARSNEYLSDVLSKVTYSTSFYSRVMNAGFNIDAPYFGNTNKKISKNWNKTIEVKKINNTGIISVTAYHTKADQAEKIARAVGYVLITQNSNYHGLGDKVSLKLLDEPITSTWPVKPNLLLNTVLSLFLGLVFGLVYVYLSDTDQDEQIVAVSNQSQDWIKEVTDSFAQAGEPKAAQAANDSNFQLRQGFDGQVGEPKDNFYQITEAPVAPKSDDWLNDWK